jgi:two-component system, chemotaxis family, protein-glutamate methylesterase/glutaminase
MPPSERDAHSTLIGCPDCSGVLSQVRDGDGPHLQFICHIGHAYSLYSLLEAKEVQLEHALWSVVSLLEHVSMIDELLVKHIDENGFPTPTQGLTARIRQVQAQLLHIRAVIEETASPDLERQAEDSRPDPA